MGFKAEDAVEQLDYDFNPYVRAKGVIAEPSSDQIDTFRTSIAAAYQEMGLDPELLQSAVAGGGEAGASMLEHFSEIMESTTGVEAKIARAVSVLCDGSPTEEQISALPHRVKALFLGWMTGTFFNPEA